MKKSLKLVISTFAIAVTCCGCETNKTVEEPKVPTSNIISQEDQEQSVNSRLLGMIKEKDIYLYGKWTEEGSYEQILLKNNTKEKEYNWKGVWKQPELLLADLNSDGKEELVTIITTGCGTGFMQEEIHIINLDTMDEYLVENPINIVEGNVKTKLSSNNIIFSVGNQSASAQLKPMSNSVVEEYKNLIYGTFMRYYVDNNTIKVSVDSKTNPTYSIAEFEVSYKFKNENFIKDKVSIKDINK